MAKSTTYQAFDYLDAGTSKLVDRAARTQYKEMTTSLKELKLVEPDYVIRGVSPYYKGLVDNLKKVLDAGTNPETLIEGLGGLTKSRYTPDNVKNYATMLESLYGTGARVEDINGLRPKDIDFKNKTIRLKGKNKTNLQRIVPMSDHLAKILKNRINEIGIDKKSNANKFIFSTDPRNGTIKNVINSTEVNNYITKIVNSGFNDIDPSFFNAEIDPDTGEKIKKSYLFRQGTASLLGNSNLVDRSRYAAEILGHTDASMLQHYQQRVLSWANTDPKFLVDLDLGERELSTFDAHWNFDQKRNRVVSYYITKKATDDSRKKLNKKTTTAPVKTTVKKISEFDAALKERVYGSSEIFKQNVVPEGGASEDFLRALDTGAPLPETPVGTGAAAVEGGTTQTKRNRAKKVNPKSRHFAIWRQQEKDTNAFRALLDRGSQSKVLVDLPMSLDTAKQTIEGVFNEINASGYMNNVGTKIEEVVEGITGNTEIGYRKAADYLPFNHKGVPDWNKNKSLLNKIVPKTLQRAGADGAAAIRLDSGVLTELMEAIEYNNRVDTVAKKLIDQFDYLSTPADVADDYVGRTAYAVDRMSLGIDKYMDDFPDTKLDIAFSFKQGTIDTPTFMSDVANRLQGVLLEQEYAPVDAQDIDNIVNNNVGNAFESLDDKTVASLSNKKTDNLINRIRIQPYIDALIETEVLDNVVYESGKEFVEDVDFDKPFADKLKYKTDGNVKATQKDYTINLRTNFFGQELKEAMPSNIITIPDQDGTAFTTRGPIVDYIDENGKTPQTKVGRAVDTFIDMTKQAGKKYGANAVKGTLIAGFGILSKPASLAAEVALEVGITNPGNVGLGLDDQELYTDLPEFYSGKAGEVENTLDEISPKQVAMVTEQERLNPEPIEDVTFLDKTKEKGKELLRSLGSLTAPIAEYQATRRGAPEPGLADNIRTDIDRGEAEDTESRDFVENVSRREVADYVPKQEATLDRRKKDAEGIMDEYGGTIVTDNIRKPRLEDIQKNLVSKDTDNQMAGLGLTSQPQGEEDATIR